MTTSARDHSAAHLDRFRTAWRRFVHTWAEADEADRPGLVERVLDVGVAGMPSMTADETDLPEPDPRVARACETALVRASGIVAAFGYFWANHDVAWHLCGHDEEVVHFVRGGWQELRNPHPGFDLWWYWHTYLDPTSEDVNPALHYLVEGRQQGLRTLPDTARLPPPPPPADRAPRRICLFAGYDADGVVDDTVVAYVRELSRFADVYYLADCPLDPRELDKLAPYTAGRWAIRHGRYDFGSYSMLARELVGWDVVEQYDELVLANDSCYLVQPFDQVFARMDQRVADWWGLQATDDHFTVRDYEQSGRPLDLQEVAGRQDLEVWRYSDFLHVGSYFLVYRSRVVNDPEFRRRLDTVARQSKKATIILKYEIGLSRFLILAGYHLDTYVDGILPYHPVYRDSAFTLLGDGFPLLKRQFIYENPFEQPGLARWKERVRAIVPAADVEAMQRNLARVAPEFELQRSFAITRTPDGTVVLPTPPGPDEFPDEERWTAKYDHWWAFPVDPVTHRLEGNARAVFEAVADDPSIRKLVLTASVKQELGGSNVATHPIESAPGQFYLLRAGTIFVNEGPRSDVNHPLSGRRHRFVGLGRGTPLTAFGEAVTHPDSEEGRRLASRSVRDSKLLSTVVASSQGSATAMAPAYRSGRDLAWWVTGSPRTDLLLADIADLPLDLRHQADRLEKLLGGRRLVLWHPAPRPGGDDALPRLGPGDLSWLRAWLDTHSGVLGVRPPVSGPVTADPPATSAWAEELVAAGALDLRAWRFPDVEVVLRDTALLVSDYTDELADFTVTGRPVVCFAPDLDAYARFPGLLHDLEAVVPGPLCRDAGALRAALEHALDELDDSARADYERRRSLLHAHLDGRAAARVVREVRRGYLPIDDWLAG